MANPVNPALAQLKDIHLPKAIGIWPLAPGWWLAISVATLLCLWLCWSAWQRYFRNRAKKRALVLLEKFQQQYQQQGNSTETAALLSTLLRRVAIAYFPRHDVAGLQGLQWLNFLDTHAKHPLFAPIADLLLSLPYQNKSAQSLEPLFIATKTWIKQQGKTIKPKKITSGVKDSEQSPPTEDKKSPQHNQQSQGGNHK